MGGRTEDPADLVGALSALGEMRVWSLIITIFGDAVAPRGGTVPSAALQAILGRLGVKPAATRVALHRLARDGWVDRERAGRRSFFGLTARGRSEVRRAAKRIYAPEPELTDPWRLAVLQGAAEEDGKRRAARLLKLGYVQLTPTAFLGHSRTPADGSALVVSGTVDALPDWAREALAPGSLREDYERLEAALARLAKAGVAEPADAAALRVLAVHQWRRLLLRHADLPEALFPEGWRGEACRRLVLGLHGRLSELADPWLDEAVAAGGPRAGRRATKRAPARS